jgi:hypothetical protein
MGWQKKGDYYYYYMSIRNGDRIESLYLGNGEAACIAARHQQAKRERRERLKAQIEAHRDIDAELTMLCKEADLLAEEALEAAGYHRPNYGKWRKRREKRTSAQ